MPKVAVDRDEVNYKREAGTEEGPRPCSWKEPPP